MHLCTVCYEECSTFAIVQKGFFVHGFALHNELECVSEFVMRLSMGTSIMAFQEF